MAVARYSLTDAPSSVAALRRRLDPRISPTALVAAGALLSATLAGALLARNTPLGIGFLVAICYAPLVALNLPAALAVWVGVLFIRNLSIVSIGPNAAGILIAFAWLATLRTHRHTVSAVLSGHRKLTATLAALLVWVSLSIAWAQDPGAGAADVWQWYVAVLLFLVIATSLTSPRHVRLVAVAFVAGAILSVIIGLVGGGLNSDATAIERATATEGRLQGGGGDPNYLAGGLIAAVALGASLMGSSRNLLVRWALGAGIGVLAIGFAATQSRAGLIGAVVAVLAALVFYRGRRLQIAGLLVLIVAATGLWFAANPHAWERVTSFDDGGNGREDLWRVAWRMTEQQPVVGVGLNNFSGRARHYVRRPGSLRYVALIVDKPHVAHNLYLQLLAETGVVGLALYVAAILACLAAASSASRRFDAAGEPSMAHLARAVLVGAIGMLSAGFFISYATDARLWVLLGLGPALFAIASRLPVRPNATVSAP